LIGIVALIVIGPEKLAKGGAYAGAFARRAQRYVNDVKSDINREMQLDELKKLQTQVPTRHVTGGFGAQGISKPRVQRVETPAQAKCGGRY
jgi:sec-independent protein translocase protein TatB